MRFDKDKKQAILQYLMEKIDAEDSNIVKVVSDTFDINQNTVHTYINEMLHRNIIRREKRGIYRLVEKNTEYRLLRSEGQIRDEQSVYDRYLHPLLRELPRNVQEIWEYILGEMINNVIDHSEAETMRIEITRTFLTTRVFIADDGVGIFAKIKEHFGMESLNDAICELFKGKLTTDPTNHSGEGIFFSSRLADQFLIISDRKCFSINKYDHDVLLDDFAKSRGTVVIVRLSNSSNKTAAGVFNQYAQVDGGFQTTMIPLKNMFDSAPVSRSQAKRICQRLDQFKEVVLDFDGITWMGQGFAHQLFVVFQNQHPDITLKPIHMGDGVEQMYRHVLGRSYSS